MRILMLTQSYPPIIGGEEQHVRNLSIELARRGHDVAVATVEPVSMPEYEVDQCGVRIYHLRASTERMGRLLISGHWHAPPLPDPEVVMQLRRIIRRERPQIVHAHNWLVYSFLPLKSWSGARLVLTLHDYSLVCVQKRLRYQSTRPCEGPGPAKCLTCAATYYGLVKGALVVGANRMMEPVVQRAVDMFLAVSRAVAAGNRLYDSRLPFQVIPNFTPDDAAVPDDDTTAASYTRQLPPEGYLLYVGTLTRDKGVDVLLRAYAQLTERTAAPPLVLIGLDKPETASILENAPAGVVAFKRWPHHAVMRAWRGSLAGLVPSVWEEPCPTVTMEAMAAGRPVVASRIGGLPDLVADGETGFLTPPGNAYALSESIARLLREPDLRAQMGQAAQRRVVEFQASSVVSRIEQAYQHLLLAQTETAADTGYLAARSRAEQAARSGDCSLGHGVETMHYLTEERSGRT